MGDEMRLNISMNKRADLELTRRSQAIWISCVCAIFTCPLAKAETAAKQWGLLQTHLSMNKTYIAHEIDSRYELPGDSVPVAGKYKTIVDPNYRQDEPRRILSEPTEAGAVGMKMAPMEFGMGAQWANRPDELFSEVTSIEFITNEQQDGESYSVLRVRTHLTRGNAPVTAKIWVNEKNSRPLRVEGIIEKVPLPGVKQIHFTVTYRADADGRSLPREVTVTYPISIFFHSGVVLFQHNLSDWRRTSQ